MDSLEIIPETGTTIEFLLLNNSDKISKTAMPRSSQLGHFKFIAYLQYLA